MFKKIKAIDEYIMRFEPAIQRTLNELRNFWAYIR
jgi:hypothetical protein